MYPDTATISPPSETKLGRIEIIDALRGFCILAIMLLHNIEHFNLYYFPEDLPDWVKVVDKWVWDTSFFLFGGKVYAIFAMLFGFTFNLLLERKGASPGGFRGNFLKRLFFLFLFGLFNSLFFDGEILAFYAVLGLVLLPVRNWSNPALLVLAIFLLLQPVELAQILYLINNPEIKLSANLFSNLTDPSSYLTGPSFWETVYGNITNGRLITINWFWEHGRIFQIPGLFLIGILFARLRKFSDWHNNKAFWIKTFVIGLLIFGLLFWLKSTVPDLVEGRNFRSLLKRVISTSANLSFTFVLVAAFVYLYSETSLKNGLNSLKLVGRMALTNYIMQSIAGAIIYYGFGLSMYKYCGAVYSLLIGIGLFILQSMFCKWWLKEHKQGPLETIWSRLSWGSR